MDDVTLVENAGLPDCDTDEITGFLAAFNKITGAHIGIHDPLYAVAYASGGVEQNLCTYCKNRSLRFRDRCGCDDSQNLSAAISSRRPHVFRCHLGVMSVIIPIMKNAQVSGVIDFGMIRPASDPMMEFPVLFKRLCGEYPESFGEKDRPAMLEAYHRTAVMDEDTLKGYITIVKAAAQGLLLNRLFLKPQARSEDRLKLYIELPYARVYPPVRRQRKERRGGAGSVLFPRDPPVKVGIRYADQAVRAETQDRICRRPPAEGSGSSRAGRGVDRGDRGRAVFFQTVPQDHGMQLLGIPGAWSCRRDGNGERVTLLYLDKTLKNQ